MKKGCSLSGFLLFALFALFFQSCTGGGGKCKLTKADSLSIFSIISKNRGDTVRKAFFETPGARAIPISVVEAREMHQAYLKFPLDIYWNDGTTDRKVRGFQIERSELEMIYQRGVKGARIYFGLNSTGQYKLIFAAIKSDKGNNLVDYEIFDDFFPCPTYCPQDDGYSENAQKSDLNWDGKVFRNFAYP